MAQSLNKHCGSLHYIGPLKIKWNIIFTAKGQVYRRLFNRLYLKNRQPTIVRSYAKLVKGQLSQIDADVVFRPGTIPITYLDSNRPMAIWHDTTFAGMVGFYYKDPYLCIETIRE